jgi:hypothetical protein
MRECVNMHYMKEVEVTLVSIYLSILVKSPKSTLPEEERCQAGQEE